MGAPVGRSVDRHGEGGRTELPMAPMVDIVFNLLIFFLVVCDLTQKDLEDITLPEAVQAVPEGPVDGRRYIVNLNRDGELRFRGQRLSLRELAAQLDRLVRLDEFDRIGRPGGEGEGSPLLILVRAGAAVPSRHVQWLLQELAQQRLHKIEFGVEFPEAD